MTSSHDGSVMWAINQITDPSLSITSETSEAVDALGTQIASFDRAKNAEFSGSNSLFDLGLYAAQNGNEKEVAGENVEKIVAPMFENIVVPTPATTPVVLKNTPLETPAFIYALNGDGTTGEKLEYSSTTGAGKFTYNKDTHAITFPAGVTPGQEYFVVYDYETTSAVAVVGDAINFPKAGRFLMEVLGTDVCDQTQLIHAYVEFPNAKLDSNVDVSFTTDTTHPFTIRAQQAYCDSKKVLFRIIVPEEE